MAQPSRTEAIQAAIIAELEARRGELDGQQPLSSITVVVRLSDGGKALDVVFRTEGRRDLLAGCRRR
jgi:hypothetical protein